MALSAELISQFAKITKDTNEKKSETTIYGSIKVIDDVKYLKIDGSPSSDPPTPISYTVGIEDNDRVTAIVKNHTVIVNGNISNPSADVGLLNIEQGRINQIETINLTVLERLNAHDVIVNSLSSTYATVTSLEVTDGKITNLQTDYGTFKNATSEHFNALEAEIEDLIVGDISAIYATIDNLEATNANVTSLQTNFGNFQTLTTNNILAINTAVSGKLSASDIEGRYANIDFSNISQATMNNFYANSGLIQYITSSGITTKELVGVKINGDLIEANTLIANKLVIQGDDGLYYRLNTNGVTTEAQQTNKNSIDGSVILASSITASKITVDDLVAFGATIGGFNLTASSLYSGVKSSAANTTRGIYLDTLGQAVFGDASNYIKYFKDTNNIYRLAISASTITLGSASVASTTDVQTAKSEAISTSSSDATTKANNALNSANSNTSNLLRNYSTTAQMNAAITLLSDRITANVTSTTNLGTRTSTLEQTASSLSASLTSTQTLATNSAKTATNYLSLSSNGLVVGDLTSGTLRENILIDTDSVDIRDGTTVLASFTANTIDLGKNSTSSIVKLCGEKGTIQYSSEDDYLDIKGKKIRINADQYATLYAYAYSGGSIGQKSSITVSPQSVNLYAQDSSSLVDGVGTWRSTSIEMSPNSMLLLSDSINVFGRYGASLETYSGDIEFKTSQNIRSNRALKVLWRGTQYMFSGQNANLSEPVSAQLTGIVLHWQFYENGAALNSHHVYSFVPKSHIAVNPGGGVGFFLTSSAGDVAATKYIYVNNNSLAGNALNDDGSTARNTGITTKNNSWVLTEVLGV